jgi:hypothetical protein
VDRILTFGWGQSKTKIAVHMIRKERSKRSHKTRKREQNLKQGPKATLALFTSDAFGAFDEILVETNVPTRHAVNEGQKMRNHLI